MIVFDVTNEKSYSDLSKWMDQVKQVNHVKTCHAHFMCWLSIIVCIYVLYYIYLCHTHQAQSTTEVF